MLLVVAMATVFFTSCSKDDETEPIISEGGDNVAIMTTAKKEVCLYGNTKKAGDVITIDWGDGNIEEFKTIKYDDTYYVWYEFDTEHTYSQAGSHTIKVTGALIYLACDNNQLTSLDVSKCTALTWLSCDNNQLTSLDISKCTALTRLGCSENSLTSLDVSKCTALTDLYCGGNPLSTNALNKIFTDLPQRKTGENDYTQQSTVYIGGNPGYETCNKSIAENKGWRIINFIN